MSLLNLSSLRGLFAGSTSRSSRKKSVSEKLTRTLAMDSLENRILLSVTPNTATDILVNTEYSENQSTNSNGNCVSVDADGDFVAVWTRGDNIYRDQNRNVGWYDSEGALHLYTDRNYIDQNYTDENGQIVSQLNGRDLVLTAYTDPATGNALIDYNVYGRYFTDEVQRLTLNTGEIAEGEMLYSIKLKTGNTYTQSITFDCAENQWTSSEDLMLHLQENAITGHTAVYEVSYMGETVRFVYDDVDDGMTLTTDGQIETTNENVVLAVQNAKNMQDALEQIFGEGHVKVSAETNATFSIEFDTDVLAATLGADADYAQLMTCNAVYDYQPTYEGTFGTYNPTAIVEKVSQPEVFEIFAVYEKLYDKNGRFTGYGDLDVAATAEQITVAFQQIQTDHAHGKVFFDSVDEYSADIGPTTEIDETRSPDYEVSVVPVYGLGENFIGFDITYVNSSGKQDIAQLIVEEVNVVEESKYDYAPEDFEINNWAKINLLEGNDKAATINTLKQNSAEIRVNPTTDDYFNKKSKVYTATEQSDASVALDADGDFVVSWTSEVLQTQVPGSFTDIYARMFSASMYSAYAGVDTITGEHLYEVLNDGKCFKATSSAILVNDITTDPQYDSAVAVDNEGNFTVVWAAKAQTLSYMNGVYMQRYDKYGSKVGDETRVDTEITGQACMPNVAMSPDGTQIAVAWYWMSADQITLTSDEQHLGGVYFRLYGYTTDENNATTFNSLVDQEYVGRGGNPTIAFSKVKQFSVGWQALNGNDIMGGAGVNTYVSQYEWNGKLNALRTNYRANSASFDSTSTVSWSGGNLNPVVVMDADGDFLVSYDGCGINATENFDPTSALPYIGKQINENYNADLIQFFDIDVEQFNLVTPAYQDNGIGYGQNLMWIHGLEMYVCNGDVDSIVEMVLARSEQNGATVEQLARLSKILHGVFDLTKGENDGVGFTMFDATPGNATEPGAVTILSSNDIANATRDGESAKYYISFDRTRSLTGEVDQDDFREDLNVWQSITVVVAWNGNNKELVVDLSTCYYWNDAGRYTLDNVAAALAIENAIQDAFSTALWSENDGYEACVEVRALSTDDANTDAMRNLDNTQQDLNGGDVIGINPFIHMGFGVSGALNIDYPADYACFEVQFSGMMHNATVQMGQTDSLVKISAVQQIDLHEATGKYCRIAVTRNGVRTLVENVVCNNMGNFEDVLRSALATQNLTGPNMHIDRVNVEDEDGNVYEVFEVTFTGELAGQDIWVSIDISKPAVPEGENAVDPYPDWNNETVFQNYTITQICGGVTANKYPAEINAFSVGSTGTTQMYNGVGMTPDGDFTFVWTQYNQDAARDVASQSIFYRAYNEEFDTVGPEAVEVYYSDGQEIRKGGQIVDSASEGDGRAFIVTFTEEMMDDARITTQITSAQASDNRLHSITNINNWILVKDGVEVANAISDIYFGMNASADPIFKDMGIVALAENKWEAVVVLNEDVDLKGGTYQLVLKSIVTDINGNALNMDGTNTTGSDWEFDFDIVAGSTDTTITTPETVDRNDPNSDPVLDEDGNVVERDGDQGFFDVEDTTADLWSPKATATDPEGDTVTVWTSTEPGNEGVYAKVTYKKWDNTDGRKVSDEGEWTIKVTDDATAKFASVAMDGAGNFVVTWTQNDVDQNGKDDWNVWAQQFDLNGQPIRDAFCVNTTTEGEQCYSQAAMSLEGDFVITWQGMSQKTNWDVYAQRYNAEGDALGAVDEIQAINVSSDWLGFFTLGFTDENGMEHITEEIEYKGNTFNAIAGVLNALNGLGLDGVEFSVTAASATQILVTISVTNEGDADVQQMTLRQVAHSSESGSIELTTIKDGSGGEFMVNESTDNKQVYASVDMDYDGDFVVSWTSYGTEVNSYESDIYARQFKSNASLGYLGNTTATDIALKDYITRVDGTDENPVSTSGIGFIIVGDYCGTGVLLADGSNMYVLTAAHVLIGSDFIATKANTSIQFFTEEGDPVSAQMDEIFIHENYVIDGSGTSDIAIIKLTTSLSGVVTSYDINRDTKTDVGAVYTRYGFGIYGEGTEGATEDVDGSMHMGQNKWEHSELGLLYYDFDDGTDAGNTLQSEFGITSDLGLGEAETCAAHGDSGGPCFVDGLIAGICHGGTSDISEYGTVGIDTQVAYFANWIDEITGAAEEQVIGATGSEFKVNDIATGTQKWSSVALDADGDFVITWTSSADNNEVHNDVYARRYGADGTAVANSFLVNTTTDNIQQLSSVSMDADGDFVIAWESYQEHGDGSSRGPADSWGIYAQRFVANGKLDKLTFVGANGELGSEFQVNTTTVDDQRLPNVAMTATGDIITSWQSDESNTQGVYTRSYYQSVDDAGPVVVRVESAFTDVDEETGISVTEELILHEGDVIEGNLEYLEVTFDEQLIGQFETEKGSNSILNLNNWTLIKDNVSVTTEIIDHIELIGYNKDDASYLGSDGTSEKNIFRVVFKDGTVLEDGAYTLVINPKVEDRAGNSLDGDFDGQPGGNFKLDFTIASEPVDEGSKIKPSEPTDADPEEIDPSVDSSTAGDQTQPAIAMNDSGDYVVIWVSEVIDTTITAPTDDDAADDTTTEDDEEEETVVFHQATKTIIQGQRYNRYGEKVGGEFIVSDFVDGIQTDPDVAMDAYGNFVVSWTVNGLDENEDGRMDNNELAEYGVYARVFDAYGAAVTNSFLVTGAVDSPASRGQQKESSVALAADGSQFVVTWTNIDSRDGEDTYGVFAQRYNFNGTTAGERFLVNKTVSYEQCMSDVAMDAKYNIVVVWQSSSAAKTGLDVYARHFNAIDAAYSDDVLVNTMTKGDQRSASVACNDAGQFVVAWASQSGSGYNISFQCFDSDMTEIGSETKANTYVTYSQYQPSVSMCRLSENSTSFALSWSSYGQEGLSAKSWGVYMNVYDGLATRNSVTSSKQEVLVNSYRPWNEDASAIAMDGYGSIGVAWVGPDEATTGTMVAVEPQDTDIFNKVYIRANVPNYAPIGSAVTASMQGDVMRTSIAYNSSRENGGGTVTSSANATTITSAENSDNRFVFKAGQSVPTVTLNNVSVALTGSSSNYVFDASNTGDCASTVRIQGLGGESVTLQNGTFVVTGEAYTLTILNAKSVSFTGSGVTAVVSAANGELFAIDGTSASLVTANASYRVDGCTQVRATASGSASARLTGSKNEENFNVGSGEVTMTAENFSATVRNFGEVDLYGALGDRVVFSQSGNFEVSGSTVALTDANVAADGFENVQVAAGGFANITTMDANVISASAGALTIEGDGFTQSFTGLSAVTLNGSAADQLTLDADGDVTANNGTISSGSYQINGVGQVVLKDVADLTLTGSEGDDTLTIDGSSATLIGSNGSLSVESFDSLTANGSEGNDSAVISDTAADDSITFMQGTAKINGNVEIRGFASVAVVCAKGGNDSAIITGTTGDDVFTLAGDAATAMMNGASFTVSGAKLVSIDGNGGSDSLKAVDTAGDDSFELAPGTLKATGTDYSWSATDVSDIKVYQKNGGNDSLVVNDSEGDDKAIVNPKFVTMTSADAMVTAAGFANIAVNSKYGNDIAVLYDSASDDAAVVVNGAVSMSGSNFFNQVSGFRKVNLYAMNGGNDTASVKAQFETVDQIFTVNDENWTVKGTGFDF